MVISAGEGAEEETQRKGVSCSKNSLLEDIGLALLGLFVIVLLCVGIIGSWSSNPTLLGTEGVEEVGEFMH